MTHDPSNIIKRPWPVRLLCVLMGLAFLFSILGMITPSIRIQVFPNGISLVLGIYLVMTMALFGISIVGYWRMKSWGVYAYLISWVIGIISYGFFDYSPSNSMLSHLGPALVLLIGYWYILKPNYRLKNET